MSYICFICEKKTETGGNRKHARGASGGGGHWRFRSQRTLRKWKPNLRPVSLEVEGQEFRERICMKCYKRLRKEEQMSVTKTAENVK